ncbi:MAG TPA: DNA-binding protein [Bacteroidales bacterium]|nr:KilA-N domain-containing protein [Lentimicrobiaceae bacterium]HAH58964.1 DNA-binding protein [Bacteroidales bacterium]
MGNKKTIRVEDNLIQITSFNNEDYISLTDMARSQLQEVIIIKWLSLKSTIEYLGEWELLYNPGFNYTEFGTIKNTAGSNNFVLSVKQWLERTHAIGITAKAGRYGGTYAHNDIAFQFGMWISPKFQLLLIKEYQRLKAEENDRLNIEWSVKRLLSKTNYHLQTDAVQKHIIPQKNYSKNKEWLLYAEEADLLNVALFGCTAKDWREANPQLSEINLNIRDMASINELTVLSNIESMNSILIKQKIAKDIRFEQIVEIASYQLQILNEKDELKSIKKNPNKQLKKGKS